MLALVWLAQLRLHSKTQQLQLLRQQGDLERKLHSSLQASALAHELGQPLSQLLLQTRLVHYRLEQVDQIPSEALKPLEQLKQSGEHIHELTAAIRRLLRNDAAVQRMDLSGFLTVVKPPCGVIAFWLPAPGRQLSRPAQWRRAWIAAWGLGTD